MNQATGKRPVVVVTHTEKGWLSFRTKISEGEIDTFNTFIAGNPK